MNNATAYEKFCRQFNKCEITEKERRALEKLDTYTLEADTQARKLKITAVFTAHTDKALIEALRGKIKEAYTLNEVVFEYSRRYEEFSEKCFRHVLEILKNDAPTVLGNGFFDESVSVYDRKNSALKIKLRENMSPQFLYDNGIEILIQNIILDEYGTDVDVTFDGAADASYKPQYVEEFEEDAQNMYELYLEEKANSPENKTCSFDPVPDGDAVKYESDTVFTAGRIKFDIADGKNLFGKDIKKSPSPIRNVADGEYIAFCGVCFMHDKRDSKRGDKVNHTFTLTDLDSSVTLRASLDKNITFKPKGKVLFIEGKAEFDKYENEVTVRAFSAFEVKQVYKTDNYPTPRVELHLHTTMSATDGLCEPAEVIRAAKNMNMPAIAVTDHGNIQSYPLIMKAVKGSGIKPLYGMEGYFVDDTARAVYGVDEGCDISFSKDTFVVFDIETTGLSPLNCGITEIGAVKYRGGEILEVFETYVNPGMSIPENITQLTGISDSTVKDAPRAGEAVKAFLEFAGDNMLVAHNAPFDISFIRRAAADNKLPFKNAYLDTVALSRYINPELKKHKLDIVAEYFGLGDFDHHRASDDTKMLAKIFECLINKLEKSGIRTVSDMVYAMENNADPKKLRSYHITILVKNNTGLKNLYKLISRSYLEFFYRNPRLPKTVLAEYREGLLIGSACESGEFYSAVKEGKPFGDLLKIADFYDYFEIQPHGNNRFLIEKGEVSSEDELSNINRQIIKIAEKQKKLVVATGDVHFLKPEDELYRQILCYGLKYHDALRSIPLYLKNTEEMLNDFAYLGKEKAIEVVVTNTRKIADMIDGDILPIPDGAFSPELPGAQEELPRICYDTAKSMYGDPLPEIVEKRLKKELDSIIANGFASLYMIARRLVINSEENGYLVGSRGSVGSSVVAAFSGVSEVNPLPPHYRCERCRHTEFVTGVGSGFDLPDKNCPECNTPMLHDGHDIPFETFLGFKGEKAPDIDLNFSGDVQSKAHKYTEVLFGAENIFRAGTVSTIADKTAYGYVKKFLDEQGKHLTRAEENRLVDGVAGVKKTTGQHPGGIVVIPKEYEIYDFTPVQHPADDKESGVITTHFAFEFLHDTLLKLDILGHDVPTEYKMLQDFTGIDVRTVPMNDDKVMELFLSTKSLGVTPEQIGNDIGTFGIPECGTSYVRKMLLATKPKCFSDLLQISGLSHGTGIWTGNGEELINNGTCTIGEIIGTRDSIMLYLVKKGLENSTAFAIMESVRKGKGLKPEWEDTMRANNVPEWYITSCKKIEYMFPKAHAAAYMISALRLAWYKVYHPVAFYASHFTVKQTGFDAELALDKARLASEVKRLEAEPKLVAKDKEILAVMQLVTEMYARGLEFLPVNIYHSQPFMFVPEDGKIRLPLSSLNGLGENAAAKIYEAMKDGTATTLDELRTAAALTKTVVEILKKNKCLGDLPESNQYTFF